MNNEASLSTDSLSVEPTDDLLVEIARVEAVKMRSTIRDNGDN
jgi:hypothetical protein